MGEEAKTVLNGNFIALSVHIRKEERSQRDLSFHLTNLGGKETIKHREYRRKEIIQIRTETNGIENRPTIEKVTETKSWLFFASFVFLEGVLACIVNSKNGRVGVTATLCNTPVLALQQLTREYYKPLYVNIFFSSDDVHQVIERYPY